MAILTHGSHSVRTLLLSGVLGSASLLTGCLESDSGDSDDSGDGDVSGPNEPQPGPAFEPEPEPEPDTECSSETLVKQAFVCAGHVSEHRVVSQRYVQLEPAPAYYACDIAGSALTPFPGGNELGEGRPPIVGDGDVGGDGDGDGDGVSLGSGGVWNGDGEGMAGSWNGDGDGDISLGGTSSTGGAGASGGATSTGGVVGYPVADGWCADVPEGLSISGVTYSVDGCSESDLQLPLRIQEPMNWYRIRIFHGDTPCERGEILADIAGQGTGEIVVLPAMEPTAGYLSIEYTSDNGSYYPYYDPYYYGDYYGGYYGGVLQVELNPVPVVPVDGEAM